MSIESEKKYQVQIAVSALGDGSDGPIDSSSESNQHNSNHLKRALLVRVISFLAFSGLIGTALFISIGSGLMNGVRIFIHL